MCAFCGGGTPSETVEHCPPRALFQFKAWPEGFEFPACKSCNSDTSDDDLIVAMLSRFSADGEEGDRDSRAEGLIKNVNAQFPGLIISMMPTHLEARKRNRALGIRPAPGQLHQDIAPITIPKRVHEAVATFASKIAKALYYQSAKRIFPNDGSLLLHWFTNVELVKTGSYKMFDAMAQVPGHAPVLKRASKLLNDQFEFKLSLSPDLSIFVAQVRLGTAFGMVIFGSTRQGQIEDAIASLREKYGKEGPVVFLQGGASGA